MSFDIHLSKIECFGKHGIYDNEKDNDQKFLIDIYIKIQDFSEDNIGNTVNYEEVVDIVIKIVEHESFALMKSLSKNIVKQILTRYQKINVIINELRANLHKPTPILTSQTEDIS